jgi:hypothetical protein
MTSHGMKASHSMKASLANLAGKIQFETVRSHWGHHIPVTQGAS